MDYSMYFKVDSVMIVIFINKLDMFSQHRSVLFTGMYLYMIVPVYVFVLRCCKKQQIQTFSQHLKLVSTR